MATYFDNQTNKGELYDLEQQLNLDDFQGKLYAVKKIIANMTVGKDVSPLFQSVLKCLQYPDIQLKKLVYLYVINYSRDKPDDSIMVVNLFLKDMENKGNPLLRALAVRTIGCLRVHKLNEYLVNPLKNCLEDEEPYVRKTAALCIPKVYEVSPQLIEQAGLVTMMQQLLNTESNGLVLANLLVSLQEISFLKGQLIPSINKDNIKKLLVAINECAEWGQIYILDQIAEYNSQGEDAEMIIERVLPRLNHMNPAVVLSTIKVVLKFLVFIPNGAIADGIVKKLTPSIVSLMNWDQPEVKYVILRSILHILQKKPSLMEDKLKSFFCQYSDPYYVKNEKLDVLVKICNEKNLESLLNELSAYVTETDTEFVKKSIRAIGSIATRFDKACVKAFAILMELIKSIIASKNISSCQEQIREILITLQKVFRKNRVISEKNQDKMALITQIFPEAYDSQSKSASAWIVGEYAEFIPNSLQIIQTMAENFSQEERLVQLEILTASVKIFVKYPQDSQQLIIGLLQIAAEQNQNPDVRDRAYMYWRMLATDPKKTAETVLCDKPKIEEQKEITDPIFIEKMILTLGCVSSVMSRIPEELFPHEIILTREPIVLTSLQQQNKDILSSTQSNSNTSNPPAAASSNNIDLLDMDSDPSPTKQPVPTIGGKSSNVLDLIDDDDVPNPSKLPNILHIHSTNSVSSGIDLYGEQTEEEMKTPTESPAKSLMNAFDLGTLSPSHNIVQQGIIQQTSPIGMVPFSAAVAASPSPSPQKTVQFDMFGDPILPTQIQAPPQKQFTQVPQEEVLRSDQKGTGGVSGLSISACFKNENNTMLLALALNNTTNQIISNFTIQIRQNSFGLKPEAIPATFSVGPQSTQTIHVQLNLTGQRDPNPPQVPLVFTVGLKTSIDVFLFQVPCLYHIFLQEDGEMTKDEFKNVWQNQPELSFEIKGSFNRKFYVEDTIKDHLKNNNIFHIATRPSPNGGIGTYFFSAKSSAESQFCIEVAYVSDNSARVTCKSKTPAYTPLMLQVLNFLLTRP